MSVPERGSNVVSGLRLVGGISSRVAALRKVIFTAVVFVVLAAEGPRSARGLNLEGNALLDFKNGVTSYREDTFQSWNASDDTPCAWTGINCLAIPGVTEERVVDITLISNELGGTISGRLGDLEYLQTVNLNTNKLSGQIPPELFKALNLTHLDLSHNNLTGELPEEIRYCYRLQQLRLSRNNLTGALPVGLGSNLRQLERLDLSMNRFNGTIPDDFGNLTTLTETLNLSNNRLSGSIPESLSNLGDVFIDMSNNNLSGPIPADSYFQSLGAAAFVGNAALCGAPLMTDCESPPPSSSAATARGSREKRLSKGAVIGIAVGCGALGLLIATLVFYFLMCKKTMTFSRSDNRLRCLLCSWRESASEAKSGEEEEGEGGLVHLTGALSFTLEDLLRASAYVLGKNGVGIVYKAVLDEGSVVAVRRLGLAGEEPQRHKEFEAEVKAIANVRHPNIVCLHSYSWTVDEKLLIYDYLCSGSLESALHGGRSDSGWKGPLTWEARIRIARGVANGLAHIHNCNPRKQHIHGDINPANILLDAFLEPRVADFGLQRLFALAQPAAVMEFGSTRGDNGTRIAPTSVALPGFERHSDSPRGGATRVVAPFLMGVYQAPETITAKRPTQKSDVYSFGVVVLELLTGRSPFKQLADGELDLVSWIRMALQEKRALSEIFDPYLIQSTSQQNKMIETLQVALACIAVNPESRPTMKQVAEFFELQASKS